MKQMCALILLVAIVSVASLGAAQDFTLGGHVGVSRTALVTISDFTPSYSGHSALTRDHLGVAWGLRGGAFISDRHGLRLELARMVNSARATTSGTGHSSSQEYLDLTNVLATVSYQYLLKGRHAAATPFLGAGSTLVRSQLHSVGFATGMRSSRGLPREAWLVGVVGYLGERAAISRSVSMSAELMARWTQREQLGSGGTILPVEFTGLSLSLGFDWAF